MVALACALASEGSFRHQDFRGDRLCSNQPEPVLFENRGNTLEQMIVTAAEDADDSRQQPECLEVGSDLPNCRPYHRADQNDIATALPAGEPTKHAELSHRSPVMRIAREPFWIRPTTNGEKHDAAPALSYRVGDRKRQAAAAADDRHRTIVCRLRHRGLSHASSLLEARRMAMVSGREPERMKAIILATRGSAPFRAAT